MVGVSLFLVSNSDCNHFITLVKQFIYHLLIICLINMNRILSHHLFTLMVFMEGIYLLYFKLAMLNILREIFLWY